MSDVFAFHEGSSPLLISVPHDGRQIPDELRRRMTPEGLELPDTDWHVARLYGFAKDLGASMLVARFSRYVIDLNRPCDDATLYPGRPATGLCPRYTFAGEPLYVDDWPLAKQEVAARVERFWRPYHHSLKTALGRIREQHGHALLWDAHSIASRVPRLFDGELPVLNVGTFDDRSCGARVSEALGVVAEASPYRAAVNGRFKGGHITRHYGDPDRDLHAVQLELAQRAYMNEETREYDADKAGILRQTIGRLLGAYQHAAIQP